MEVTIKMEVREGMLVVHVNGKEIGQWAYVDGAIETVRKELIARFSNVKEYYETPTNNSPD